MEILRNCRLSKIFAKVFWYIIFGLKYIFYNIEIYDEI